MTRTNEQVAVLFGCLLVHVSFVLLIADFVVIVVIVVVVVVLGVVVVVSWRI